jgi:hypothetical protein
MSRLPDAAGEHVAMMRVRAILPIVILLGCSPSLPTAPSELTMGVVLYEHANFLGKAAHVTGDIRDLDDFEGPCIEFANGPYDYTEYKGWDDCISSIRVAPGWRATLYEHDGFDGKKLEVTADISNLQLTPGPCKHDDFNDCVTSIRVFAP